MNKRGFASDNNAGVHPVILEALKEANEGHVIAYGDDPYTRRAKELLQEQFGRQAEVFFVLTGTGANVLGLSALTQPYHAVICAQTAHIAVDECGAPEKFTGCKLITVDSPDGKLNPAMLHPCMHGIGFEHHVQPRVISVSQSSEMGTVYKPSEIKELADFAHARDMFLHMDGARLANAAVSLGCSLRDITTDTGVDVLSFGGTKNGLLFGEAVIFLRPGLADDFKYRRKQGMQLASKMRFMGAQFIPYFEQEVWKKNARHANQMARLLCEKISSVPGITITQAVEANGVFAILPEEIIEPLQQQYFFYVWDEQRSEVRWMTSFDTLEEDIIGFVKTLQDLL